MGGVCMYRKDLPVSCEKKVFRRQTHRQTFGERERGGGGGGGRKFSFGFDAI